MVFDEEGEMNLFFIRMFSSLPSGTALFSESALHEAETLLSLRSTSNGGSGEELRDRVLNAEWLSVQLH